MPLKHARLCLLIALGVGLLLPAGISAQTQQRRVEKSTELLPVPEPVEVLEVVAAGRTVGVGQLFAAPNDWLRGLMLKLRNISSLPIRHVEIQLEAVPAKSPKSPTFFPLRYGRVPISKTDPASPSDTDKSIKPGEQLVLSLDEKLYDFITEASPKVEGGNSFERARIILRHVVFEGDRAWRNGYVSRRDPDNPLRWNVTDEALEYIEPVTRPPGAGSQAPPFVVSTLASRSFDLTALRGEVVVLNFWFIGCAPCRAEIPELNKLVKEYKNKRVVFLAIATDDESQLRSFLKEVAFDFHVVPNGGEVLSRYGLTGFPRHVVIDKLGYIEWVKTGGGNKVRAELSEVINRALNKK